MVSWLDSSYSLSILAIFYHVNEHQNKLISSLFLVFLGAISYNIAYVSFFFMGHNSIDKRRIFWEICQETEDRFFLYKTVVHCMFRSVSLQPLSLFSKETVCSNKIIQP